jgi:hypothetical protein
LETVELSISKAPAADMLQLLRAAGVFKTLEQSRPALPPDYLAGVPDTFSWVGGEDARSAAACERLGAYLSAAGVPMGATPGYKIVDVHRSDVLTSQVGRFRLRGRTDAIITPFAQFGGHAQLQSRVVVDFKQSVPPASTDSAIAGQSLAELAASNALSTHDVMVVFTDLNTTSHVWRMVGDALLVWEGCSTKQAVAVMAAFLRTESAPVPVAGLDAADVPGEPDAKRRRREAVDRLHELVPSAELLWEQLLAFAGDGDDDNDGWMAAREVAYSALPRVEGVAPAPWLSYFS